MENDESKEIVNAQPEDTERHGKKNIMVGTVLGYVSLALSIISGLLYTPWIISSIGKSSYGLYTLCNSLINLFLFDFGLSSTINTFLSRYRAKGETDKIKHFIGVINKLYLLIDIVIIVVFVVVYFLIDYIYVGLTPDERESFKTVFLIAAAFSVVSFPATILSGVLESYEEFIWQKVIDIVNKLLYIAFTALAITMGWGLLSLVIVNSGAGLICIIIRLLLVRFKLKIKTDFKAPFIKSELKGILAFSIWAAVESVASRLIFNITPTILGIVSDSSNIAVFGIVSSLEGYVYTFGAVMSGFFLPKIARIQNSSEGKEDETKRIDNLAVKVGKIQFIILALVEVGFACCGKEFILLWMKDESYLPAYYGVMIIIIYQLVYVPQLVYFTAMYSKGYIKDLAIAAIAKAIVNLGLSFLFSWLWGAFGACLSIAIARVFELVLENIYYKKRLHVDLAGFFKKVYLRTLIPSLICLAMGLLEHFFLPFSTLVNFFIIMGSIVVVYCALTPFVSMTKDDRVFLKGLIARR
jgi:O-antigen/teichoic acid export membrane protein